MVVFQIPENVTGPFKMAKCRPCPGRQRMVFPKGPTCCSCSGMCLNRHHALNLVSIHRRAESLRLSTDLRQTCQSGSQSACLTVTVVALSSFGCGKPSPGPEKALVDLLVPNGNPRVRPIPETALLFLRFLSHLVIP